MKWLIKALHQSHAEEVRNRNSQLSSCEKQITLKQRRMDKAYDDMLDGRIGSDFFERKMAEWRSEIGRLEQRINSLRAADKGYIDLGRRILELSVSSCAVFDNGIQIEKRHLLAILFSNSSWGDNTLAAHLREPFECLRVMRLRSEAEQENGRKYARF